MKEKIQFARGKIKIVLLLITNDLMIPMIFLHDINNITSITRHKYLLLYMLKMERENIHAIETLI